MTSSSKNLVLLEELYKNLKGVAVSFSGGVDSAVLAAIAFKALGDKMIAVTGISPSTPTRDIESAKSFCQKRGIRHLLVNTKEFDDPVYVANPENRCYYCKKHIFAEIAAVSKEQGFHYIAEGTNSSEILGHRPGMGAKKEREDIVTPFVDLSLTKEDIRQMARDLQLEVAERPSTACLASRIPFGEKIDADILKNIDTAENFLISLGVKQVRVRFQKNSAKIETDEEGIDICVKNRKNIMTELTKLGFKSVALDLGGYRTGAGMGI